MGERMLNGILNYFRAKKWGIQSKPLKEGVYSTEIDGETFNLAHSTFNTDWLPQLGIVPTTILELGSFDGGDGLRFTKDYNNCRVISVEADPERFKIVSRTLKESGAELIQTAVCAEDGPIDWFTATIDGKSQAQGSLFRQSSRYKKKFPFVKQVDSPASIEGTRIDSLCNRLDISDVDLLHMDIEGAEYEAIKGLGNVRPKAIFLEMRDKLFLSVPQSSETDKLLRSLGYKLVIHLGIDRFYVLQHQ
jgi:2-O-methyltransferase